MIPQPGGDKSMGAPGEGGKAGPPWRRGGRRGMPDFSSMTPEQLERIKDRMRSRGLTDKEIEERLKQLKERFSSEKGKAEKGTP